MLSEQATDLGYSDNEVPKDSGSIGWIYDRLRHWILSGRLQADSVMNQVHLAAELGVSRTPIREVLRMLEREGLVQSEHNRRVRVSSVSIEDLEEIYAARIVNEALAVRISMQSMNTQDVDELATCLEEMRRCASSEDYESWTAPHSRFHELLTSYAGPRLVRMIQDLSDHAARCRRMYMTQANHAWPVMVADHTAIRDAVVTNDPAGAGSALGIHYARTAIGVIAMIDPGYDPKRIRAALRMVTEDAPDLTHSGVSLLHR